MKRKTNSWEIKCYFEIPNFKIKYFKISYLKHCNKI